MVSILPIFTQQSTSQDSETFMDLLFQYMESQAFILNRPILPTAEQIKVDVFPFSEIRMLRLVIVISIYVQRWLAGLYMQMGLAVLKSYKVLFRIILHTKGMARMFTL